MNFTYPQRHHACGLEPPGRSQLFVHSSIPRWTDWPTVSRHWSGEGCARVRDDSPGIGCHPMRLVLLILLVVMRLLFGPIEHTVNDGDGCEKLGHIDHGR